MEVEPTDQEQPSWAKIPILVSANLFALMNYKTKKVARLVCGDWRFAVDHLTEATTMEISWCFEKSRMSGTNTTRLVLQPRPQTMSKLDQTHPQSDPSTSPRNEVESIQNAVAFILKSIRSPKLTLLNIFVYENFLIHQQEDYWKQTLFEEFLEAHQVSLKELYLHEFRDTTRSMGIRNWNKTMSSSGDSSPNKQN
ncbi:unnamed protein product [Allacma fusca]|uniref:Uncharacterized protein n=1 Tax=Allacma fusca TaxID=39272 RepID=A0A8J2JL63_9HEXA|nr:unnamed protein product [Allacma fusca]